MSEKSREEKLAKLKSELDQTKNLRVKAEIRLEQLESQHTELMEEISSLGVQPDKLGEEIDKLAKEIDRLIEDADKLIPHDLLSESQD